MSVTGVSFAVLSSSRPLGQGQIRWNPGKRPLFSGRLPEEASRSTAVTPGSKSLQTLKQWGKGIALVSVSFLSGIGGQQFSQKFLSPQVPVAPPSVAPSIQTREGGFIPVQGFGGARMDATLTFQPDSMTPEAMARRAKVGEELKSGRLSQAVRRDDLYNGMAQYTLPAVVEISYEIVNPHYDEKMAFHPFIRIPKVFQGMGSGVFLSADGVIATNFHVAENPLKPGECQESIDVKLLDGTTVKAKRINADELKDLAVYKLEGEWKDLPYLSLAPEAARVGDEVMAVGHPGGFDWTATFGKVTYAARELTNGNHYLQTDADIGPGNSGGAIVNNRGELVAITDAVSSINGVVTLGMGIPQDVLKTELPRLMIAPPPAEAPQKKEVAPPPPPAKANPEDPADFGQRP